MKYHKLYKNVVIIKETEKAVCVNNIGINEDMEELAQFCNCCGVKSYINNKVFWLPKSQVQIENNKIVAITKWLYNQQLFYLDTPFCLEEDVKKLQKKTCI